MSNNRIGVLSSFRTSSWISLDIQTVNFWVSGKKEAGTLKLLPA